MNDEPDESTPDTPPRGGRPRAAEPGISVATWIPVSKYDQIQKIADRNGLSISAFIRSIIERKT